MKQTTDERYIAHCIQISEQAIKQGEAPFASLIVHKDKILCESGNGNQQHNDVTSHAEILVMRKAQQLLNTSDLRECDIYTNCEPCPMCSFMIRELKFRKLVFALRSPHMGGWSKWNIMEDKELEKFKPFFDTVPEIVPDVLAKEAIKTFQKASFPDIFTRNT